MKTRQHISDDKLLEYAYRQLSDPERDLYDVHLSECTVCRSTLQNHENMRGHIKQDINAVLNTTNPARHIQFSGIADRLRPPSRFTYLRNAADMLPGLVTLVGLLFVLNDLGRVISALFTYPAQFHPTALSTLACFFFVFASVEQFDQARTIHPKLYLTAILVFMLWLGSAIVGLQNIVILLDLFLTAMIVVGISTSTARFWGILFTMFLAMVYIAVVIGGGEYHYRRIGQPSSWKVFSFTIVGQLFILILPFLL